MTTTEDQAAAGTDGRARGRVGWQAATAGLLLAAGTQLEWVLDFQDDDGTVVRPVLFAVCLSLAAAGSGLLAAAAIGLRSLSAEPSRTLRIGAIGCAVGAALVLVATVTVLVSGLASGSPTELSFVAFGLGIVLLGAGGVTAGLGLRRSLASSWWPLPVLAGVSALGVVAIPLDPWHDLSLVAMCAAWSGFGVSLLRR